MSSWQPSAEILVLRKRAEIITTMRDFFSARHVLEVETPLLSRSTNPDPHIESFQLNYHHTKYYLQTSPEFHMKRLLAKGSGCIYQMSKAFRVDEQGRQHNPEFSMLEWYRIGFDQHDLMQEVAELLQLILKIPEIKKLSYRELFLEYCKFDPFISNTNELKNFANAQCKEQFQNLQLTTKDDWLNLILTHCIEPQLKTIPILFIYDFPASQAALAKINDEVAARFEVYCDGLELGNGFHELTDFKQQQQRFMANNQYRAQQQQSIIPIDDNFLQALQHGLPDCAGVALGIDRLIMLATKQNQLSDVMSFGFDRA